jgi:hypothetical protein
MLRSPRRSTHSTAEVILRDGDQIAGDLPVGNIEDASLGGDDSAAGHAGQLEQPLGDRHPVGGRYLPPRSPADRDAGVDATSLTRLRVAPTGEMVFQSGKDWTPTVCTGCRRHPADPRRGGPRPVFPDRILGDVRIGSGGVVRSSPAAAPARWW